MSAEWQATFRHEARVAVVGRDRATAGWSPRVWPHNGSDQSSGLEVSYSEIMQGRLRDPVLRSISPEPSLKLR